MAVAVISIWVDHLYSDMADDHRTTSSSTPPAPQAQPVALLAPLQAKIPAARLTEKGVTVKDAQLLPRMRTGAKVARDLYLALHQRWRMALFSSLAKSHETHMIALTGAMARFGLRDSVADDRMGIFSDPDFAMMYGDLLRQGRQSIASALRVGGELEETLILELDTAIGETQSMTLHALYKKLRRSTYNHLMNIAHGMELRGDPFMPTKLPRSRLSMLTHGPIDTDFFPN
ncbi:DUF2202 domain-containing protein [Magnetofaba australis]|nr:DUF2202 domain-containing protein [Magnetofaba australis]